MIQIREEINEIEILKKLKGSIKPRPGFFERINKTKTSSQAQQEKKRGDPNKQNKK